MVSIHDQLRDRLLARAGLLIDNPKDKLVYRELYESQWSIGFQRKVEDFHGHFMPLDMQMYCRNRMTMGGLRYGVLSKQQNGNGFGNVHSAYKRLRRFEADGNAEWLCDVFNLAMIEFLVGQHPKAHQHDVKRTHPCPVGTTWRAQQCFAFYEKSGDLSDLVEAATYVVDIWLKENHSDFHFESGDRKDKHPTVIKNAKINTLGLYIVISLSFFFR